MGNDIILRPRSIPGRNQMKSALGSFLGFIVGTGLKLVACGVMMYYIIVYL